jgi:hypothetical protein
MPGFGGKFERDERRGGTPAALTRRRLVPFQTVQADPPPGSLVESGFPFSSRALCCLACKNR